MKLHNARHGTTHTHLMYVEAHLHGQVSIANADSVTYETNLLKQTYEKALSDSKKVMREGNPATSKDIAFMADRIKKRIQDRDMLLDICDEDLNDNYGVNLVITRAEKPLVAKESYRQSAGTLQKALTSDQLF